MGKVEFSVNGMKPASYSTGSEMAWRRLISQKAATQRANLAGTADDPRRAPEMGPFCVSLVFSLAKQDVDRCDLDNLIKPVIDTLFTSHPLRPSLAPMPTGALLYASDKAVYRIAASKNIAVPPGLLLVVEW